MRGPSQNYPAFPEIEAELGYNPARFLDQRVGKDGQTAELSAKALIRGIQDVETIRAWIEVEVALGRADGGPRQQVITWLNRRQARIEADRSERSTATADDRDQPSPPRDERSTDRSEPASDAETTEPVPAEPSTTAAIDGDDTDEPIDDPTCPVCGEDLTPEEIAGQLGHWCCECRDFREPQAAPSTGATQEDPVLADGGEETTPRCPDCRGELTLEEIRDETAHWCPFCGGFREPIGGQA